MFEKGNRVRIAADAESGLEWKRAMRDKEGVVTEVQYDGIIWVKVHNKVRGKAAWYSHQLTLIEETYDYGNFVLLLTRKEEV
jgi:hypothetical protein